MRADFEIEAREAKIGASPALLSDSRRFRTPSPQVACRAFYDAVTNKVVVIEAIPRVPVARKSGSSHIVADGKRAARDAPFRLHHGSNARLRING